MLTDISLKKKKNLVIWVFDSNMFLKYCSRGFTAIIHQFCSPESQMFYGGGVLRVCQACFTRKKHWTRGDCQQAFPERYHLLVEHLVAPVH